MLYILKVGGALRQVRTDPGLFQRPARLGMNSFWLSGKKLPKVLSPDPDEPLGVPTAVAENLRHPHLPLIRLPRRLGEHDGLPQGGVHRAAHVCQRSGAAESGR